MKGLTGKRMLIWLVCVAFVLFVVLTATLAALHGGHECSGHDCSICAQLHYVASLFKQLSPMLAGTLCLAALLAGSILLATSTQTQVGINSLVQWKVRMNH